MTSLRQHHLLVVVLLLPAPSIRGADYIWIEAEALARPPAGFKAAGWGNKQYLAGETWLFANIDAKEAEALPADGITLAFPFDATNAGDYDIWGRIGYEFARSPFLWRIDQNEWITNGPNDLTTDLMEIAEWTEIAWIRLGKTKLTAGKHTLEIKYERRTLPNKKQPERILAGLDCFCLTTRPFRPDGPNKPDAIWKAEIDKQSEKQLLAVSFRDEPRNIFALNGTWQIARWDEQEIKDRDLPIRELPTDYKEFHWKGRAVPGNRDTVRPDFLYCHRFLYRAIINVPETRGRSAHLRFPSTALLASVFVNGKFCGGNDTPCAAWDADISPALKAGANEVVVAIKDCYYAIEKTGDGKSCRSMFNYPVNRFYNDGGLGPTRFADFPVLYQVRGAGIFETPELIITDGIVSIVDVFAKPSVAKKELGLEITLRNSGNKSATVTLHNDVKAAGGVAIEKTFAAKHVEVPAHGETLVAIVEGLAKPRLWWPDAPEQQEVVTRVSTENKTIDATKTKFGFREWGWTGQALTLNGIPWHFHADLLHNGKLQGKNRDKIVDDWKKAGVNTVRYWGHDAWVGTSQRETLDWYDRIGMPIRRTGIFDGQIAPYMLVESKDGRTVARKALFDRWIKQMKAGVKAERNHPSIFIWSIENEITYINVRNLGWLDACEPEIRRGIQEVLKLDPTRPAMIDGGDALRDRSLPIYGNHYNESNFRHYPDEARTMEIAFSRHKADPAHNPWQIGDDRPLFLGESFFANGYPPAAYAAIQGDEAFLGRSASNKGVRLFARMLAEGYRWHGVAGFQFWMSGDEPDDMQYKAFQPVCALVKEWDSAFASGSEVKRTIKVFNDTRFDEPIEFEWSMSYSVSDPTQPGHDLDDGHLAQSLLNVRPKPGAAEEFEVCLKMPVVKKRTAVEFSLTCKRNGAVVFQDKKAYHVIPTQPALPQKTTIHVLDPKGIVKTHLKKRDIAFTDVDAFEKIPAKPGVLIVGPDALTPRQATDNRWQALAAAGAKILVLDQQYPLHFQATPADLDATAFDGRIAFPENHEHPIFAGLDSPDFFCWSGDHVVYRRAYRKPTHGARSLLQCDDELSCSSLLECPVGQGLLLLCQAAAGTKLGSDAVAQRLFDNMLAYCSDYKPTARPTAAVFSDNDLRLKLLDSAGLQYARNANVVDALSDAKTEIVVVDASAGNLARLASDPGRFQTFLDRGGQAMFWGLTDKGLPVFNKLVGVNHVMRPFRMERVTLAAKRDPLLAGLTARDVVLEGTEKIYPWAGDRYPAADTFTDIVDLDDIAPFGKSEKTAFGWSQMTNGLTSADSWKFIYYHNLKDQGGKPRWEAEFPKAEQITRFSIMINAHYHRITKMRLIFDGNEKGAMTLDLKPEGDLRQDFDIPIRNFKKIALEPLAWDDAGAQPVIGVDNVWIQVKRGGDYADKVVPLLNIGGLVRYKIGKGAVVLNQVRVQAAEPNPINAEKKRAIVATLLRNMGASFAGEKQLIVGHNLQTTPIALDDKCNQFLSSDKGWINGQPDLSHFPVGNQKLSGVNYLIRDFKTSPLPSCIMLAGQGAKGNLPNMVAGIPVDRKADALLFLHTFHRVKEWKPAADKKEPPVVFVYVVKYVDGSALEVPVRYGRGVANWIASDPAGLVDATVAWSAAFPKDMSRQAVVYQMMWKNPRPAETIKSIDVKYDDAIGNQYGIPIILGISAGSGE